MSMCRGGSAAEGPAAEIVLVPKLFRGSHARDWHVLLNWH